MNNLNASTHAIKLFDRKFHANTLRNKEKCPRCRAEFTHNYDKPMGDAHVKSNRPFLLVCGHNMCENCVYHNHRNLACSVCLSPIEVPLSMLQQHNNFHIRDFFDLNFFLLGEINDLRFYRRDGAANNSTAMFGTNNNNSHSNVRPVVLPTVVTCNECEQTPALGNCRSCKVCYCRFCFNMVHLHSKVLKTHKLVPLDKQTGGEDKMQKMPRVKHCRYHRKVCDRFCRKCRFVCCALCAKMEHGNHGYHLLFDENERIKDDIMPVLETVKTTREQLRKSQQIG